MRESDLSLLSPLSGRKRLGSQCTPFTQYNHPPRHTHTHTVLTLHPDLADALVEGSHAHHHWDLSVFMQLVSLSLQGEDIRAGAGGEAQYHKLSQGLEGVFCPVKCDEMETAVNHGCGGGAHRQNASPSQPLTSRSAPGEFMNAWFECAALLKPVPLIKVSPHRHRAPPSWLGRSRC